MGQEEQTTKYIYCYCFEKILVLKVGFSHPCKQEKEQKITGNFHRELVTLGLDESSSLGKYVCTPFHQQNIIILGGALFPRVFDISIWSLLT